MTNNQKTFEYAEQNMLNYVETTTESNGYPSNLRFVLTFDKISDLEFHAERLREQGHDYQRLMLHRKDGWQLWHRFGADVRKGMFRIPTAGDSITEVDIKDTADEIAFRVIAEGREFDTLQDLQKTTDQCTDFRNDIEEILLNLKSIGNEQPSATVFYDPDQNYRIDYYATDETTGYYYDTHQYQVALLVDFKDEETNEE